MPQCSWFNSHDSRLIKLSDGNINEGVYTATLPNLLRAIKEYIDPTPPYLLKVLLNAGPSIGLGAYKQWNKYLK